MQNIDNLCMGCMKDNGGEEICHFCHFDKNYVQSAPLLPLKTVLDDRYVVGRAIDRNGDGVTYLGWDKVLGSSVRIREFLPEKICSRIENAEFITVEQNCDGIFNSYLKQFLKIARTLAGNRELSSLFPVYDVMELNGTAYYVSENITGMSLENFLNRKGAPLTWEQVRFLMIPAISAMSVLHSANIVHGGISPKNLFVCKDGKLRITGFSIADVRRNNDILNPELFSGYAAIEQYDTDGATLTPATDNYAFAACIYRCLIGAEPQESTARRQNDKLIIPAKIAENIPGFVLDTMSLALQILPDDRLSSAEKFKSGISNQPVIKQPKSAVVVNTASDSNVEIQEQPVKQRKSHAFAYAMFALIITVSLALIVIILFFSGNGDDTTDDSSGYVSKNSSVVSSNSNDSPSYGLESEMDTVPQLETFNIYSNEANDARKTFKITVVSKVYSDDKAEGTIISQDPAPATKLSKLNNGEMNEIKIVVSMGKEKVKIKESLAGKTEDEARYILLKYGFSNSNIVVSRDRYSIDVPYDTVICIEPDGNAEAISRESQITLYLNSNVDMKPTEEGE